MAQVPDHRRTIQPSDHAIAMLLAAGVYSLPEIATALGRGLMSIERTVARVPFQALVAQYAARFPQLEETDELSVAQENTRDARANLAFIRAVRDGTVEGDPRAIQLRLLAAKALLYGQVARKAEPPAERPLAASALDAPRRMLLERVLVEDMRAMNGTEETDADTD